MKKRVFVFLTLLALAAGILVSVFRAEDKASTSPQRIQALPKDQLFLPPAEPFQEEPIYKFKAAGTGEPLKPKEFALEKPSYLELETVVQEDKPEGDILDEISPKVKEVAEQIEDLVDSFDEKTLQTTKKLLDKLPLLEMEPEKAQLRPKNGGVELKITIPADTIKLKLEKERPKDDPSSSDE
ncbi:hypothetical protein Tlie_1689 [Thermovirga lienii DSM 17291]|uniref:Uncharacterized protein n=1 Tax=Thermovirga lienii (strain ATCC BAA-1197 / DSM 17291 / Cas60314) TaxID=580340 RepID=G7V880_THELD|nr:hypothetical protein [Thermovirga lienii]AER67411.1 hypothetical protein Tlie_1689 [Thermovirga lienii DSM 17291]